MDNLRLAFEDLLTESVWMDAETQVLAKENAELMVQLVGYPDWFPDNTELDNYYAYLSPFPSFYFWSSSAAYAGLRRN